MQGPMSNLGKLAALQGLGTNVAALFKGGQELVRLRDEEAAMEQLCAQFLARLLVFKKSTPGDESATNNDSNSTPKRLHLFRHDEAEETESGVQVLNQTVFAACSRGLEELSADDDKVLKEGWAEVQQGGKSKKMLKRHLILYTTRLEIKEDNRELALLAFQSVRVPPQKASQHLLQVTTDSKVLSFNFENAADADGWQHGLLRARIQCLALLLDLVPSFRNLAFAQANRRASTDLNSDSQKTIRYLPSSNVTITSLANSGTCETYLKFAFLEFQRVAMTYDIALSLHDSYATNVAKLLAHLDSLAEQRTRLREKISVMESEMAAEERISQIAGRKLSNAFGNVLESVGIVHESLTETHSGLVMSRTLGLGSTEEEQDQVYCFRQTLNLLERGLAMDGPLKRQLQELEIREEESAAELQALEEHEKELSFALEKVREKRDSLESVMSSAGHLQDALSKASASVVEKGSADLSQLLEFSSSLPNLPGLRQSVFGRKAPDRTLSEVDVRILGGIAAMQINASQVDNVTPVALVNTIMTTPSMRAMEHSVLRCFEYFMKPLQLMELITIAYCEGPGVHHTEAKAAEIEQRMASVRLRSLNLLRKWVRMQGYHFRENLQLAKLLQTFLDCVKVTGNEKLALLIEAEASEQPLAPIALPVFVSATIGSSGQIGSFFELTPQELARQLSLLDQELYRRLETREFLKNNFMRKNANELSPNIKAFAGQFNHVASVVTSSILLQTVLPERKQLLKFWIETAKHLRALRNYQSLLAIVGGLTCTPVNRLKHTWENIPNALLQYFDECKSLMDKNFKLLREELETASRPVIPYIGCYQRDLVYLEESPTMKKGGESVNLTKMKSISNVIANCLQYQNSFYNWFEPLPAVQSLVMSFNLFDETAAHETSLKLEPRPIVKTQEEFEAEKRRAKEENLSQVMGEIMVDRTSSSGRRRPSSSSHHSRESEKSAKSVSVTPQKTRHESVEPAVAVITPAPIVIEPVANPRPPSLSIGQHSRRRAPSMTSSNSSLRLSQGELLNSDSESE